MAKTQSPNAFDRNTRSHSYQPEEPLLEQVPKGPVRINFGYKFNSNKTMNVKRNGSDARRGSSTMRNGMLEQKVKA